MKSIVSRWLQTTSDRLAPSPTCPTYVRLDPAEPQALSLADGDVLRPGRTFHIRAGNDEEATWSVPFEVMSLDDHPTDEFYRSQELSGIHHSPIAGAIGTPLMVTTTSKCEMESF